jgi:hypothetical protein
MGEEMNDGSAARRHLDRASVERWQRRRSVIKESQPAASLVALDLNAALAVTCPHGRDPCISRCGVERIQGMWVEVPLERRLDWVDVLYFGRH